MSIKFHKRKTGTHLGTGTIRRHIELAKKNTFLLEGRFIKYSKHELKTLVGFIVDTEIKDLQGRYEEVPEFGMLISDFKKTVGNYYEYLDQHKDIEFFKDFYVRDIIGNTCSLIKVMDQMIITLLYLGRVHNDKDASPPWYANYRDPSTFLLPKPDDTYFLFWVKFEDLPLYVNDPTRYTRYAYTPESMKKVYKYRLKIGK